MTEARTRETRGEVKGQKAYEGPRKKHDTAGRDLEALEGDIPDSCRHAWIILGPLLARGPLLSPKNPANRNQICYPIVRRDGAEKARNFLRLLAAPVGGYSVRRRFLSSPTEARRLTPANGRSPLILVCLICGHAGKFEERVPSFDSR